MVKFLLPPPGHHLPHGACRQMHWVTHSQAHLLTLEEGRQAQGMNREVVVQHSHAPTSANSGQP